MVPADWGYGEGEEIYRLGVVWEKLWVNKLIIYKRCPVYKTSVRAGTLSTTG